VAYLQMPESIETTASEFSKPEFAKVCIDYLKHITTLASGSIVLIATFFDKFPHPRFKMLMFWAIAGLGASIMFSCACMLAFMTYGAKSSKRTPELERELKVVLFLSVLSFLGGICGIAMFAMLNFYK